MHTVVTQEGYVNEQYEDQTGEVTPVDESPAEGGALPAAEAATDPMPMDDFRQDLRDGLVALGQKITRLEQHFETKLMYDESKDQTIDALHRELQDYREGLQFVHLRPLVNDLLTLYDDLGGMLAGFAVDHPEAAAEAPVNKLLDSLHTIQEDMQYTLEKHGFDLYEHPGDEVDRKFQRVQGTVPTDDPAQDRQVAVRLRRGLRYADRVLRPEIVQVYRHEAGDEAGN
jgi:molecular chaperone GrpE